MQTKQHWHQEYYQYSSDPLVYAVEIMQNCRQLLQKNTGWQDGCNLLWNAERHLRDSDSQSKS